MGNCCVNNNNQYTIDNISISTFVDQYSLVELVKYKLKNINYNDQNFILDLKTYLNSNKFKFNFIIINTPNLEYVEIKLFNFERNTENKIKLCSVYFIKSLLNSNKLINYRIEINNIKKLTMSKINIDVFNVDSDNIISCK